MRIPLMVIVLSILFSNTPLHSQPNLGDKGQASQITQRINALRERLQQRRLQGASAGIGTNATTEAGGNQEEVELILESKQPTKEDFIRKSLVLEQRNDVQVVVLYHENNDTNECIGIGIGKRNDGSSGNGISGISSVNSGRTVNSDRDVSDSGSSISVSGGSSGSSDNSVRSGSCVSIIDSGSIVSNSNRVGSGNSGNIDNIVSIGSRHDYVNDCHDHDRHLIRDDGSALNCFNNSLITFGMAPPSKPRTLNIFDHETDGLPAKMPQNLLKHQSDQELSPHDSPHDLPCNLPHNSQLSDKVRATFAGLHGTTGDSHTATFAGWHDTAGDSHTETTVFATPGEQPRPTDSNGTNDRDSTGNSDNTNNNIHEEIVIIEASPRERLRQLLVAFEQDREHPRQSLRFAYHR